MTTNEAIDKLVEIDPNRQYCAGKELWRYVPEVGDAYIKARYVISVHPGFGGVSCDQYSGETMEEAVDKAFRASPEHVITSTPNEE